MAKINLTKARHLVDELGLVEEYSREIKAEVDERKKSLLGYVGKTIETDEFQCSVFDRQGKTLNVEKLMRKFKITAKQLATCYDAQETSTVVSIKRLGTTKREQRQEFLKSAKRKVS